MKIQNKIRLQKYLAMCGIASRRMAEKIIKNGEITVNGKVVKEPFFKIDADKDHIKYKKKLLKPEEKVYVVLNKPKNYICSTKDEKGRKIVLDLINQKIKQRVYPVGRLDFDATGCILLTNDGEFANKVMNPKYEIEKEYIIKIKGRLSIEKLEKLKNGLKIMGRFIKPKKVEIIQRKEKNDIILIVITGGMNHFIKNLLDSIGLQILWIKRQRIGPVTIKGLEYGEWRYLTEQEKNYFLSK